MLLVFGPRSTRYDFGPQHPLTPRRFGPGIDLLRAVGAEPAIEPEPASDEELLACHTRAYLDAVKGFSTDPGREPAAGIARFGDVPPFAGMHEAGAAVAGGSLRAIEAILAGDAEHAFHPGGGLHHAMPDRASGFCIYNDPALAIARARRDGLRVLYVDLDVHHGDGVQAIHWTDPGVLTFSIHETGRYLFPGTGSVDELGEGSAAGTSVNVPLEPFAGEAAWTAVVDRLVPELAAAFGPDLVVSQHGADSHAWDPLAHLRVTVTAHGRAARVVDRVAHEFAHGRWLATGGGGYDAYRVVPRTWAHVWLAGAHTPVPESTPEAWRARWEADAADFGQAPPPERFDDAPNAGVPLDDEQAEAEARAVATAAVVRELVVPALMRRAEERGWWRPLDDRRSPTSPSGPPTAPGASVRIENVDAASWTRLSLAPRVIAPSDAGDAHALVEHALATSPYVVVTAAVAGGIVVGVCVSASSTDTTGPRELIALGVAPAYRGRGVATRLLEAHLATIPPSQPIVALVTVAERDPVEPLDRSVRAVIARRLLERAGFTVRPAEARIASADRLAIAAVRP